jgi:predicted MFS family arabinose efflux permease
MVIGPATARVAGLSGLFWLTAALALGAIVIVTTLVPDPPQQRLHRDTDAIPGDLLLLLRDRELLRLDAGIFILHAVMTASFVVLPLTLRDQAGLAADAHWWAYLVVLIAAIALMLPCVIHADRRDRQKPVFLGAIGVLVAAHVGLAGSPPALGWVLACMVAYFAAFNVLEASLPSLVSRLAPSRMKGTALGAYSTSQYLGAFTGGLAGGLIHAHLGLSAVYLFCAAIALGWLALAAPMRNPRPFTNQLLRLGPLDPAEAADLHRRLAAVPGVAEAVVMPEEGVAYLKVDRRRLDQEALQVAVRP